MWGEIELVWGQIEINTGKSEKLKILIWVEGTFDNHPDLDLDRSKLIKMVNQRFPAPKKDF